MRIIEGDRTVLYKVLRRVFSEVNLDPIIAEVGVLRGDNALNIQSLLSPRHLFLIDSWSSVVFQDYERINSHRAWVEDMAAHASYFGGDLRDQGTLDRLFATVTDRFNGQNGVSIIRKVSLEAETYLLHQGSDDLNLAYIDASHQFEAVVDDLVAYSQLINHDLGFIQLNDCCFSEAGNRQNLGVLEAAVRFCKMQGFVPVAVVNRAWTDVILAHKNSRLIDIFFKVVQESSLPFVDVPNELLGSMTVIEGAKRSNLSFLSVS